MNFNKLYIISLISFLIVICHFESKAAPKVEASLDSANLLMGQMTTLHLKVTQEKGKKGEFTFLKRLQSNGVIPICEDSVELRTPSKIDTIIEGNLLNISYDVPLQAFDSGYYRLPQFIFVIGNDSVKSNTLQLKVYPVVAEADTPINDYASVAQPENSSIFDFIPDWIIELWWLWIIFIICLTVFLFLWRQYRQKGYIIPKKPEPSPYEIAVSSMLMLKEKKLWEQGMEKEYYTELTDILRTYLFKRFGINAMEMTSRQILACLKADDGLKEKRSYFRQILNMADFVKFAKVRPLPDDNVAAYDNAWRFIQETKPQPVEIGDANIDTNGKGGKK